MPTEDRTPAQEIDLSRESSNAAISNINIEEQQQLSSTIAATTSPSTFVNVDLNDNNNATTQTKLNGPSTTFIFMPTSNELPTYEQVIYQKQTEANGQNPTIAPSHYLSLPPLINLTEVRIN